MIRRIRKLIEGWLFAPAAASNPLTWPRRLLRYPYALLRDLLSGQLNLHAMGLVYQTLLALVPLIAFSFSILQVFGAHRELEPLIFEFFRPMGADAGALTQRVMQFADKVHGSLVGSVGLALLIWTLVGTLKKVEDSLNYVWHVEMPRSFTRRIAEYVGTADHRSAAGRRRDRHVAPRADQPLGAAARRSCRSPASSCAWRSPSCPTA